MASTSCRSTKEIKREIYTVYDTIRESRIDTVYIKQVINNRPPVTNTIVIEKPCDSLGNLKPVYIKAGPQGSTAEVKSDGDKLIFTGYSEAQVDSIIKTREVSHREEVRKLREQIENHSEKVVTKTVWAKVTYIFLIWAILATVLLLSRLRKFIPTIL